jgi:hypothetical protein
MRQAPSCRVIDLAATPPPRREVTIQLRSRPTGALVYESDALIGHTPINIPEPQDRESAFTIVLRGFGTKVVRVVFRSEQDPPPLTP